MNKPSLYVSAIVLGLLVSGCASNSTETGTADTAKIAKEKQLAENEDGLKCTYIRRTGSHRRTKRCVDREAYEKEREAASSLMQQNTARGAIAPKGANN